MYCSHKATLCQETPRFVSACLHGQLTGSPRFATLTTQRKALDDANEAIGSNSMGGRLGRGGFDDRRRRRFRSREAAALSLHLFCYLGREYASSRPLIPRRQFQAVSPSLRRRCRW